MQRHPSVKVQAAACRVLWYLACNHDNLVRIAAEGCINAIVTAMQRHPNGRGARGSLQSDV
jgi:hypothetical protein